MQYVGCVAGGVITLVKRCDETYLATVSSYEQIKKNVSATKYFEKELMEIFSSFFRLVYRRGSSVVVG
jgi:hypothetical protein